MEFEAIRRRFQGRRAAIQAPGSEFAVLVPLVERPDGLHLLYEVRSGALHHQPGEVCFPGGRLEGSETPLACAVRETREELGVTDEQIDIVGPLDFTLRGTSVVYPFLARLQAADLQGLPVNLDEVAQVFTVPLAWLRENPPEIYRHVYRPHPDDFPYADVGVPDTYPWAKLVLEVPIYHGLPYPLWGMTARITKHLIDLICEEERNG